MFAVLSRRLRFVFLMFAVGLVAAPVAYADIDACFNFSNAQDYARAETEAKSLLLRNDLSRTEQRDAQSCLGSAYDGLGRAQDALIAFQKVESLSQTSDELVVAYSWLSTLYIMVRDFDRGDLYAQRAGKLYKALRNKRGQGTMLGNQATVMELRGDKKRALDLYQESLLLQPDNTTVLVNIAGLYEQREEYGSAVKTLRQAIAIDRRTEDSHATATHQIQLGDLLRKQGKLDLAEKELTAGLSSIRLLGDKRSEALACFYFGLLKRSEKKSDESREWYQKAESLYREIGYTLDADSIASLLAGK